MNASVPARSTTPGLPADLDRSLLIRRYLSAVQRCSDRFVSWGDGHPLVHTRPHGAESRTPGWLPAWRPVTAPLIRQPWTVSATCLNQAGGYVGHFVRDDSARPCNNGRAINSVPMPLSYTMRELVTWTCYSTVRAIPRYRDDFPGDAKLKESRRPARLRIRIGAGELSISKIGNFKLPILLVSKLYTL